MHSIVCTYTLYTYPHLDGSSIFSIPDIQNVEGSESPSNGISKTT